MVSWDGCNYNGDLVPTGVYTIIASQADGSVTIPEALRPYLGGAERLAPVK